MLRVEILIGATSIMTVVSFFALLSSLLDETSCELSFLADITTAAGGGRSRLCMLHNEILYHLLTRYCHRVQLQYLGNFKLG